MNYDHHSIVHRALVTYSSDTTGEILVKIPSVLGINSEVSISYIGRSSVNGRWAVPTVGSQIVVSSDDENMTNVFWLQTEPYNALGISSETGEPMGFANRLDSVISFDNATRVFTISPVDGSYDVWVRGVLYTITSPISITLPTGHGGYNIYFDTTGTLQVKTAFFELEYEAPVSFIYWNTVSAIMFADERHGITLDWATHEYLHRTRGAAIANGFEVSGYTTTGTGSTVADAKITIANGTFFDEDLQIDITHSATPVANTWQQRLQSGAYIPVYYKDSAGWQKTTATQYPFKFATTPTASYPQYNLNASSLVQMDNNRYGIAWIVATNGLNEPVISVMGQAQYSNIGDAHAALWSDVTMTGFPSFEFRPLWKVIFQAISGSAIRAAIRQLDDLRTFQGTAASGGTSVSALDGLVDVTLTSPTSGQLLAYNGSQWVNTPTYETKPRITYTSPPSMGDWAVDSFGTSKYLRFTTSVIFTCTSAGFCDVIVTGGGGGGGSLGGGGGGGQVVEHKNLFINTGTYVITIGAGGAGGTNGGRGSVGGTTIVDYLAEGAIFPVSMFVYAGGGGGGGGQNAAGSGIYGQNAIGGGGGHSYSAAGLELSWNTGQSYYSGNGGYSHTGNPYKGGGGGGSVGDGVSASVYAGGDGGKGLLVESPLNNLGVFGSGGGGSYHANYTGYQGKSGDGIGYGGSGSGFGAGSSALNGWGGGGGGGGYYSGTYYNGGKGGDGSVLLLGVYV